MESGPPHGLRTGAAARPGQPARNREQAAVRAFPPAPTRSLDSILAAPGLIRFQITVVVVCALIAMIDGFDTQVIALAAPDIAGDWSVPAASFGFVFAIGLLGGLLGALIFGYISDRFGRKPTLLIAVTAFGLICLATVLTHSIGQLVVVRFLTGLGLGGALPSIISITAEYTPVKRRATIVGLMFCGFPLGAVVGAVAATRLIPAHGWHSVFIAGGVAPLVLVPVIWKLLPESARFLAVKSRHAELQRTLQRIGIDDVDAASLKTDPAPTSSPVARLFTEGRAVTTVMLWVTLLLSLLLTYLLVNWIPIIAREAGMSARGSLLGVAALNLGAIIGCLVLGRIADRFNATTTIGIAFGLGAVAIALIGHASSSSALLIAACLIAGGFSIGGQVCTVALCAGFYDTSLRATGVGWAVGIGRIGAIAGPILGGILLGARISAAGIFLVTGIASVGAAIAILIIGAVNKRARTTKSATQPA